MMSLCDCEVNGTACLGKGWSSVLDPRDKVPQDENKTKSPQGDHSSLCDSCHKCWPISVIPDH